MVDQYLEVADAVQADIDLIESEMFTPRGWRRIDRVYQLKREVLELKRAVAPLTGPMRALSTLRHPLISDETRNYFRDVDDHLLRVKEQVISFDELLSSILQGGPGPGAGVGERGHAADRGLGRDPGGADDDRRDLRDELRARAAVMPLATFCLAAFEL